MLNNHIRFLIIDDFPGTRGGIKNLLGDLGFLNVDEVDDGVVAMQKLQAGNFDFVISNWQMSTMDGLAILKNIRAKEELKEVPVLMVTARITKKHIVDAVQAGADGFLARPFTAEVLFEKLNLIIGNTRVPLAK